MYSRDHGPIYGGLVTWGIMLTFLLSQLESRDTINLKRWGVKCIMLQCIIISFIIALWPFDPLESEREIAGKRIFFRFSYPFSSTFFLWGCNNKSSLRGISHSFFFALEMRWWWKRKKEGIVIKKYYELALKYAQSLTFNVQVF